MKSVTDLILPPGYYRSIDADSLTVYLPDGSVYGSYGPAYSVEVIEETVWNHYLDIEERTAELDGLLGRGDGRPSVHDLLTEALDATGWTGAEKAAFLESFHAALQRKERDLQRRLGVSG